MSPGWYGQNVDAEIAADGRRGRYRYDGVRLLWAVAGAAVAGVFLIVMMGNGADHLLARLWVAAVGAYGVWYAYRRVTSPVEFVIWDGIVRGIYLRGQSKEWRQAEVAIRPRAFWDFMDGSQRVVDSKSGRVIFTVFIDLPEFSQFAKSLGEDNAAA